MTTPNLPSTSAGRNFSGRIIFHQRGRQIVYDLAVTDGKVTGWQHFGKSEEPVAEIVGGWFDVETGHLNVLIQGSDIIEARFRTQSQQFHVDRKTDEVTLEHMLFGYGLTLENTKLWTSHVLDVLEPDRPSAK